MPKIIPNLWFDTQALEAAEFYVSVFPRSRITDLSYYGEAGPGPAGTVLTVDFELDGQPVTAINGGPRFTFDEAISLLVECADQDEIDHYWERLTDGGEESMCGWLKDRYGLSWQVVPAGMEEMLKDPDDPRSQRRDASDARHRGRSTSPRCSPPPTAGEQPDRLHPVGRRGAVVGAGRRRLAVLGDLDDGHHPVVLVGEDVAVEHVLADEVGEAHADHHLAPSAGSRTMSCRPCPVAARR